MSAALRLTTTGASAAWEEAYEALAFTAFALDTQSDDPAMAALARSATGLLGDWEKIEHDRRALRAAAIAGRAHVRVADSALDAALLRIATDTLEAVDGDRASALYKRLFPVPHERVIAMGLDGELPSAGVLMAELDAAADGDAEAEIPPSLIAHRDALRACLALGNQALGARADAYAALGRLEARVESWLEGARAETAATRQELTRFAEARGLSPRWIASFFAS